MRFPETVKKLKRGPQVVLPKDFGMIAGFTGVGGKSLVVDAGAGSGFLAIMLGNVAKKVVSYEWREEFADLADANVKRAGLDNVEIKRKDIFLGIDEKEVDLVTLDLANSEKVLPYAHDSLKQNGYAVGYLPNIEQVKKFVEECERLRFREIFTIECMIREMLVRKEGCRPETKGLLHTAYLTFAKK